MSEFPIAVTPGRMGRPPLNVKPTMVRLTNAVRARIIALVGPNRMAVFVREAVDEKLAREESEHKPLPQPPEGSAND